MKEVTLSPEHLPEGIEAPSRATLVSGDELDDLKAKAGDSDKDFAELKDRIEEIEELREEKEDLKEENEKLRSKAEAVDEVKEAKAEELAEFGVLDKEDYMTMDVASLRSKASDLQEKKEEEETPNPNGDPGSQKEFEETPEEENAEEIADLKESIEWYENNGWESNADAAREELAELQE